jgi:hypothetical protein
MMVIGRVGVEIRVPRLDNGLAQQPGFGELVQRIVDGRQDTEIPEVTASPCNSSAVTWRSPFSRRSCAKASRCRVGRKPASRSRRMAAESGAVPFML